jgi:hypothetical protein
MLKNLVWQMFKKTGGIEYFLQYKALNNSDENFMTEASSEITLDGEKCRISKPEDWSSGK